MRLLKTITDVDLPKELTLLVEPSDTHVGIERIRTASRGVVFDGDGKVSLLHVSNRNYYKLPGGGLEHDEDPVRAFKRECLEEIGCSVIGIKEVGEVIEIREKHKLRQTSYCFIAEVDGPKKEPHLEQGEIDEGFKQVWVTLDEAITLLKGSRPTSYNGPFIVVRDLVILEAVQSMR
jgi:8-oxo-dGTP diphosphatase